jgi:hypothetical protein
MKIDVDLKERLHISFLFLLQSYKVLMGSLLVVFVPQNCGEHVCSVTENLFNQDIFHNVCLFFNFSSVLLFLICYGFELKRENWCVEYLDINKNFSDNHLKTVLNTRPEFKKQINIINDRYYNSSRLTILVYSLNLILSTIYIFLKSLGLMTLTSYLSFVLLIIMKLNNAYLISNDTKKNDRLLSSYMSEYKSFNVIDKDHKLEEEKNKEVNISDIIINENLRNRSPKSLNTVDINMI